MPVPAMCSWSCRKPVFAALCRPSNRPAEPSETVSGCCGGAAPAGVDACCVADAKAKDEGKSGCGCGSSTKASHGTGGMTYHGAPWPVIWALGITQIIGYGTLFYSYSILAPAMAAELAWSQQWVFGILSGALLAGAVLAPIAGHWADQVRRRPPDGSGLDCSCGGASAVRLGARPARLRGGCVGDGSRFVFRALQHGLCRHCAAWRADCPAQHHAFDGDCRLCVDPFLASHHLAA